MKNKKLLWLPVALLLVLTVLTTGILTACDREEQPDNEPSESQTQPEQTQPEETELPVPPETDPEETQPEATEPEPTTDAGSSGPSVNTGTGGGYDPGTTEPGATEPETEVTEPVIEVPPAGSEKNPYYENIQDGAGEFTTVKVPAGATVHYRIQTAGKFLRVEDDSAAVVYDGNTYEALEGVVELELPEDDSAPICLTFTNNGEEDKNFPVAVLGPVGSQSNPVAVETLNEIAVTLEQGDLDGLFYQWIADRDGMLKLWQQSQSDVELNVFVDGEAVQLTRDNGGKLCTQVKQADEILIQVTAQPDSEGNIPAAEAVVSGYIAQMVKLSVTMLPFEAEPVTVEAGQSVYFTVTGAAGKFLQIPAENAQAYYGEETLLPENGTIVINAAENTAQIEVCNTGDQAADYTVKVNYSQGSILNPQVLTQLGDELQANTTESSGHYYAYTASAPGVVTFQIWTAPEDPSAVTNIFLSNNTSGETVELAKSEDGTASVWVDEGDELSVCVTVEDAEGNSMNAQLGIMGNHFGTQEDPLVVGYPGFTAKVPAGKTMYYQCFNMNGIQFALTGTNAVVAHNGTEYSGGEIRFTVVSQGREPAVFAITNPGAADAQYEVVFTYPLGWMENPAPLVLGINTLTQEAGAPNYYYTFTAPKDGKLSLIFDETAQWVYGVNNLTQGTYCDTQWSDSDPLVSCTELDVKMDDEIQIFVNTYDKDNSYEAPAGEVIFKAKFVTGPVQITNTNVYTTATLFAGETCQFTGNFQGLKLKITGSQDGVVEFGGNEYRADSTGTVTVEIPEGGAEQLTLSLYNGAADQVEFTFVFSAKNTGTAENPEILTPGSHTMSQTVVGGSEYHYKFVATKTVTLIFTFEDDVDCVFTVNGTIVRYTHKGQVRYAVRVKSGAEASLVVNTYDPENPTVSPIGDVDFTVTVNG